MLLIIPIARTLARSLDWFVADDQRALTLLEQLAAELGVEPERLRAALERVLFGG